MRKYDTIPGPHIFHVDTALPPVIPAGDAFSVSIVLVARANERFSLVISAMATVGATGLGGKRAQAFLAEVSQQLLTGAVPRTIAAEGRLLPARPPEHPPGLMKIRSELVE
jgi:hypothetical protein